MGQLVGRGFDPVMRTFYERSLAAGKPKKLGSTACIRKLLTMLNAAVRTGRYWHPTVVGPYKLTATLSLSSNATALASGAYPLCFPSVSLRSPGQLPWMKGSHNLQSPGHPPRRRRE